MSTNGEQHFLRNFMSCAGRSRAFAVRHLHHFSLLAFVSGFVLDSLMLPPADSVAANVVVSGYLIVVVLLILLQQFLESRISFIEKKRLLYFISPLLPGAIQLIFGALFSALLIFYTRSASLAGSWIFLLLFAILALGNECFHRRFARLEFQFAYFFISLYVYAIYALPLLFGTMGMKLFVAAGVVSATLAAAFFAVLEGIVPAAAHHVRRRVLFVTLGILITVNVLYFARIIPPIPLVLVERGVYHLIIRDPDGNYRALEEQRTQGGWKRLWERTETFRRSPGSSAYVYSAVYAPTALKTPIVHEWQYRDPASGKWSTKSRIIFPILGGRAGGYRGYSEKSYIDAGQWRVIVKTSEGREIGRIAFVILDAPAGTVVLRERVL